MIFLASIRLREMLYDQRFGMSDNKWLRLLAYVTGLVNQELLLQNEYLAAENNRET